MRRRAEVKQTVGAPLCPLFFFLPQTKVQMCSVNVPYIPAAPAVCAFLHKTRYAQVPSGPADADPDRRIPADLLPETEALKPAFIPSTLCFRTMGRLVTSTHNNGVDTHEHTMQEDKPGSKLTLAVGSCSMVTPQIPGSQ